MRISETMRTNEERIASMHRRTEEIKQEQRAHRVKLLQSVSAAASFAAVILLAVFMPKLTSFETVPYGIVSEDMHASMLRDGGVMGYVVIAVIAFLLGAAVTAFCFKLKKWQDDKNREADL